VRLPRLLIAAPGSSSGKTTVALLLAAWARSKGLDLRPFKAGPDFIDAQYLGLIAGRPAPSLDPWFLGPPALRRHFSAWAAGGDLALVEGVMGLFDGKKGAPFGRHSSAELARVLDLPVVLVLDARKAGPTLAAQALGLARADPRLRFAGVVLNRVSGPAHAALLAPALRRVGGMRVFGWLPAIEGLELPERHLGLSAASEMEGWQARLRAALPLAGRGLDFEAILGASRRAPSWNAPAVPAVPAPARRRAAPFTLAVAKDEAFHFYYPENLGLLEGLGARLAFFSPLRDRALPKGTQGLLLGGGFPECFGARLAANRSLRAQARRELARGLPAWAECGGLMWLCRRLVDAEGRGHAMVGALDAVVRMTRRLQHFGYAEAFGSGGAAWPAWGGDAAGRGLRLKGHEFHHSGVEAGRNLATRWTLLQGGKPPRSEGYALKGGVATYFHAYLPSSPGAARSFAAACRAARPLD